MSWSFSAHTSFRKCPRQWFYKQHVAHHAARECPTARCSLDPELFGDKKMRHALDQYASRAPLEARQEIYRALLEHSGGELTHDDCTFMFVEFLPRPPFWRRRLLPGKRRGVRNT